MFSIINDMWIVKCDVICELSRSHENEISASQNLYKNADYKKIWIKMNFWKEY